jgi:hypothetical protein
LRGLAFHRFPASGDEPCSRIFSVLGGRDAFGVRCLDEYSLVPQVLDANTSLGHLVVVEKSAGDVSGVCRLLPRYLTKLHDMRSTYSCSSP